MTAVTAAAFSAAGDSGDSTLAGFRLLAKIPEAELRGYWAGLNVSFSVIRKYFIF